MSIERSIKDTGFYAEISGEQRKIFLARKAHKFIPTVDTLYYSIFINGDKKEMPVGSPIWLLIAALEGKKEEALERHEPQAYSHGLTVTVKSYKFYKYCLTETDLYDIFVCGSLPNEQTPRIVVQLRALGLWTRGVESVMVDAYQKVAAILDDYGLSIEKCREQRIDYCYHTNAISSPNAVFSEVKGVIKGLHTNLEHGMITADLESTEEGTVFHKNYVCFGQKKSNNVRARIYDKVKEVIEMGYKSFFFPLWHENGLISYYDKWCMEYAFPHKNVDYLHKARLAFYVAHCSVGEKYAEFLAALEDKKTSLAAFKRMADAYMPKVTAVVNVEYETKRKFYYYSDAFIENFGTLKRDIHPHLQRLYKILDNREVFLDYLTTKTLSFYRSKKGDDYDFLPWWRRLRNTKLGGIKAKEKLLRDYACKMDKRCVQRRAINAVASAAVYDDNVDTGFVEDWSDFVCGINDNDAHEMGRVMLVTEHGEILQEVVGEVLKDYRLIKAKKEVQLKNRKKRKKEAET